MERKLWSEFTVSKSSVTYEPIYSYKVVYNGPTDGAYLYATVYKDGAPVTKSVLLENETLGALINLNILSLADAQAVTGATLSLSVTDLNGNSFQKSLPSAKEKELLALLDPYVDRLMTDDEEPSMLDGPSMEYQAPWIKFELCSTSTNTLYSFYFTVWDTDTDTFVSGECQDKEGHSYENESGIPITHDTLEKLRLLYLEQLPDVSGFNETEDDMDQILDDDIISLSVTLADGTVVEKYASGNIAMEIYQLLLPYFINK
ncbi:MAG: hypothetical protein IKU25_02435 [Clostridia bacterium]|nr:hypothetical protein [Clostridia bacterium]